MVTTLAIVFWASQCGWFTICVNEVLIDAYPGESICLSRDVGLEYRNGRGTILIGPSDGGPSISIAGSDGKWRTITGDSHSEAVIKETSLQFDHFIMRRK